MIYPAHRSNPSQTSTLSEMYVIKFTIQYSFTKKVLQKFYKKCYIIEIIQLHLLYYIVNFTIKMINLIMHFLSVRLAKSEICKNIHITSKLRMSNARKNSRFDIFADREPLLETLHVVIFKICRIRTVVLSLYTIVHIPTAK